MRVATEHFMPSTQDDMNASLGSNKSSSSPSPAQHSYSYSERSLEESVVIAFSVGVIGFLAIFGNIIVVACVRVYHRLRTEVGSYFIVNLCVADMMTSMIVMSSSMYSVLNDVRTVDKRYCQFVCCMNYTLIIVSMLTLGFIAVDRFLAVVYALRYHCLMKKRVALLLIGWSWLQGLCFGLAPVFEDWIHYDYGEIVCAIRWVGRDPLIYVIIAFILCFFIPGGMLATLYCKVMAVANLQIQKNHVHLGSLSQESDKGRRSTVITTEQYLDTTHEYNNSTTTTLQVPDIQNIVRNDSTNQNDEGIHSLLSSDLKSNGVKKVSHDPENQTLEEYSQEKHRFSSFWKRKKRKSTNCNRISDHTNQHKPIAKCLSSTPVLENSSILPHTFTPPLRRCKSMPDIDLLYNIDHSKSETNNASCSRVIDTTQPKKQRQSFPGVTRAAPTVTKQAVKAKNVMHISYSASKKALRSLLIVVLAFFVCMTPFSVTKLYKVIMSDSNALPIYVNVMATMAQFCSSAINPLIYGVLRKDFQRAFKILIKKVGRLNNNDMSINTISMG